MAVTTKLRSYFTDVAGDDLRSIIDYEPGSYEIAYLRADVEAAYSEHQIDRAIDESRIESLSAPLYHTLVSDDHGEVNCLVKCFENVLEMNFVVSDAHGTLVALDAEAMADTHGLVSSARDIVLTERYG